MILFSKHENCTYLGFDSVKYEAISTINTFWLLACKNNSIGNNFFKMVICIHENRFTECSTVKLSILYKWVSCPSAFLLLSLFKTFYQRCQKMYNRAPLNFYKYGQQFEYLNIQICIANLSYSFNGQGMKLSIEIIIIFRKYYVW